MGWGWCRVARGGPREGVVFKGEPRVKVERGAGCVSGRFKCAGVSTTCVSVTLCRLA